MKKVHDAHDILARLSALKGFRTRRELAEFFGVCPSAVSDWVNRKGNRIPDRRLGEICSKHSMNWHWLAYGEGAPYEVMEGHGDLLCKPDPDDLLLLERLKSSPRLRRAVKSLLGLGEDQMLLVSRLAESLDRGQSGPARNGEAPYLKWNASYPL